MRIMLVDDSQTMRNVQKKILAGLGYTDIVEASDGLDALSKVGAAKPELILLDWNMPNLDGMGFLQKFRLKDKTTLILMVTTESEKTRVVDAIKAGVNNYLVKPFMPEDLKAKIEATLARAA